MELENNLKQTIDTSKPAASKGLLTKTLQIDPGTLARGYKSKVSGTYHPFSDLRTKSKMELMSSEENSTLSHLQVLAPRGANNIVDLNKISPEDDCAECATECQDPSCSVAEITSQCTDQCVVVACNDPTHSQMSCHGARHCNVNCADGINCSDCNGFEEFLQCCTDYHAYFSEERGPQAQIPNNGLIWDQPLDDMACDCGDLEPGMPDYPSMTSMHSDYSSSPSMEGLSIMSSANSVASDSFPSTPLSSSGNSYATPLSLRNLPATINSDVSNSLLSCMWGNCNATFHSFSDLAGHVNLQHLRLPSSASISSPQLTRPTAIQQQQQQQFDALSCLWGDCNLFPSPESIPGPSSGNQFDAALSTLASHLFQDHLGLPDHLPVEIERGNLHHDRVTASSPPALNSNIPPPPIHTSTSPSSSPDAVAHECSAIPSCHWRGCSETFTSCEELTTHLTSAHVGAGKAHYECFWEECKRNGDQGFSSKQKICRHLQSHTGHRPFQCKVCKQNFSEAATLQQHMRRHTQEKPYVCDVLGCGKAFAITGALTIHKRTHNGQKPFKCTYCGRAFSESSNLSKHLRTHTGDRPYPCTEGGCGKAFARPDQLARHVLVHRKKSSGIVVQK